MTRRSFKHINVIGAGLAGSEAAYQLAQYKIPVHLYEMKPDKKSPAHHSDLFGELVCSNSLKAESLDNATGLLKEEMRRLGSLIIKAADNSKIPAGGALAVDREEFAKYITDQIRNNDYIKVFSQEVTRIPDDEITIIATGPLTSGKIYDNIMSSLGDNNLHFFDAAAPIVSSDTIDMTKAFRASRYGKGGDDYINCPMTKEEYLNFYQALITAELADVEGFDKEIVFEGCMPIEVMAKRGEDTMRFGPLKPVGLIDPRTESEPYACLQLRQDDREKSMYNLVGFQTRLKWGEQKRVFGLIPGLENVTYLRYGVMHRNSYICSPRVLNSDYSVRVNNKIFFAGQLTGVEGYVPSASSGFVASYYAMCRFFYKEPEYKVDNTTVIGALANYISDKNITKFQPMNANFGIIAPIDKKFKGKTAKKDKNMALANRSLTNLQEWIDIVNDLRE